VAKIFNSGDLFQPLYDSVCQINTSRLKTNNGRLTEIAVLLYQFMA
jgi:hypothetical protein